MMLRVSNVFDFVLESNDYCLILPSACTYSLVHTLAASPIQWNNL